MILQFPSWLTVSLDPKLLSQFVAFLIGLGGFVQFYENFTPFDVLNGMFRTYKQSKIKDKGMWGKLKRQLAHPWGPGLVDYVTWKVKEFHYKGDGEGEEKANVLLLDLSPWKFKVLIEGVFIMGGGVVSAVLMLFSDDGDFSWCALYLVGIETILFFIVVGVTSKAFKEKEEYFRKKYETLLEFQSDES